MGRHASSERVRMRVRERARERERERVSEREKRISNLHSFLVKENAIRVEDQ